MTSGVNVTEVGAAMAIDARIEGGEAQPFEREDPACAARAGRHVDPESRVGRRTIPR